MAGDQEDDFITIVSVGSGQEPKEPAPPAPSNTNTAFVTVLAIGSQDPPEEQVTVYRLPGEKLGFGLKFEGGTKSAERVRRLFIQSCAADSPAGRAKASWGALTPGDEILQIDRFLVTSLTRLECVRCLKDSNVAVELLVRHSPEGEMFLEENVNKPPNICSSIIKSHAPEPPQHVESKKSSLPPPVPPRKIPRKSCKETLFVDAKKNSKTESNQNFNDGCDAKKIDAYSKLADHYADGPVQMRKGPLGKQSPGRVRRPAPLPSAAPPPEAQVYTDLFCQEKENGMHVAESESDDTGSSISTVIDRLSSYSSFPGSVESSIPSTPTLGSKQLNIQNVLHCIEDNFMSDIPPNVIEEKIRKTFSKSSTNILVMSEKQNLANEKPSLSSNEYSNVQVIRSEEVSNNSIPSDSPVMNGKIRSSGSHEASSSTKVVNNFINSSDPNNNMNIKEVRTTENHFKQNVSVDVVDHMQKDTITVSKTIKSNSTSVEPPKPLPRNLNKKNIESHSSRSDERPYDDTLSPTKLHCIESWLQDSHKIIANDHKETEREIARPEALPRLIDFVPKMPYTNPVKTNVESSDANGEIQKPIPAERVFNQVQETSKTMPEKKDELHVVITNDSNQDWMFGAGSPHLETIGEDDEEFTCPTLLVTDSARQPPAGDSGSDRGSKEAAGEDHRETTKLPKVQDIEVEQNKAPDGETRNSKKEESKECSVVAVSRGPRPPPDGRENPAAHQEGPPSLEDRFQHQEEKFKPPAPTRPPPLPVQSVPYHNKENNRMAEHLIRSISYESPIRNKTPSKSYGRGKDAKSEGSVKDKIAMFSVNRTPPAEQPPPIAISPQMPDKKTFSNSRPVEPLRHSISTPYRSINHNYEYISKSHENLLDCSNNSPRKINTDWKIDAPLTKTSSVPVESYDDVDKVSYKIVDENLNPTRMTQGKYDPKVSPIELLNKKLAMADKLAKSDSSSKDSHRNTIDFLIEQRRKSMKKLRGLVIPDSQCVSNLPEIKFRDSLKLITVPENNYGTKDYLSLSPPKSAPVSSSFNSMWDNQSILNNVPKYSPAFKRKPLQVYGPKSSTTLVTSAIPKYADPIERRVKESSEPTIKKTSAPSKPPRTSLDMKRSFDSLDVSQKVQTLPSSFRAGGITNSANNDFLHTAKPRRPDLFLGADAADGINGKTKNFHEADSDNDSAVSSTQSSYLSSVSSPTPSLNTVDNTESDCSSQSIMSQDAILSAQYKPSKIYSKNDEMFENGHSHNSLGLDDRKRNVCRSLSSDTSTSVGSSNSSTLTSGSQASCSSAGSTDTGSHRVLKPRSIEAINRKNILASAKCRSGKDNKFGSPLIERKFSDDSNVESTDEGENKPNEPPIVSKPHPNYNDKIKFVNSRSRASRIDGNAILPNSILKVAYSTLVVEDKPKNNKNNTDSTCSDTGSDSETEIVTVVKLDPKLIKPKKFTNGSALPKANNDNFNRRVSENYTKPIIDQIKSINKKSMKVITNNEDVIKPMSNGTSFETRKRVDGQSAVKMNGTVTSEVNGRKKVEPVEVSPRQGIQLDLEKQDAIAAAVDEDSFEVRLARGAAGGIGVTLAGGADCEAKQVTIHKVLLGSAAERDGRLCKGDEVVSINGHSMGGLTHAQSVAILKETLPEVSIVVKGHRPAAKITPEVKNDKEVTDAVLTVILEKADTPGGAGLGISLEGGGNKPLLINKLFTGGAAARSGVIVSGSELLSAGGSRLTGLTRTQAWGLLRALPAGPCTLLLRPP